MKLFKIDNTTRTNVLVIPVNSHDSGELKTPSKRPTLFCQWDGGGEGTRPRNCQRLSFGNMATNRPPVIHTSSRLLPAMMRTILMNFFMRSCGCPSMIQRLLRILKHKNPVRVAATSRVHAANLSYLRRNPERPPIVYSLPSPFLLRKDSPLSSNR